MVGMRTAANYQSKINNEQQETTEINIHTCARLLATHWIKQLSDQTVGFKKYEYFTYSIVGVRTAADHQSKMNSGQKETAEINIHACAWLLATRWIKRRSDLTIGSKNMNILPFNGGAGGLPN